MYVLNVKTESGNHYSFVFETSADDEIVENFLKRQFPEEYEEVGFVNWSLHREYIYDWSD